MNARSPRPLVMVCGMISTKDPRGFLEHFGALSPAIWTVPFAYPAALSAEALSDAAGSIGSTRARRQALLRPSPTSAQRPARSRPAC